MEREAMAHFFSAEKVLEGKQPRSNENCKGFVMKNLNSVFQTDFEIVLKLEICIIILKHYAKLYIKQNYIIS